MLRKLVAGLGNPGAAYERTYHNVGMQALDAAAVSLSDGEPHWVRGKFFSYARSEEWIFVKPLVFMNESGAAVREAARKFGIPAKNVVLVHDDSDLPLGAWRISRGRGTAGHHGVSSVIAALGTNDFTRIRIGIRPVRETSRKKAGDFVLKQITKSAALILKKVFEEVTERLPSL